MAGNRDYGPNLEMVKIRDSLGMTNPELTAAMHSSMYSVERYVSCTTPLPEYRLRLLLLETGLAKPDYTIDLMALRRLGDFIETENNHE